MFNYIVYSWTISGKEAEALHAESEDEEEEEEESDPIQKMLKSKVHLYIK